MAPSAVVFRKWDATLHRADERVIAERSWDQEDGWIEEVSVPDDTPLNTVATVPESLPWLDPRERD